MKQFFKSYFSYSTREIRGITFLIVLIIVVSVAPTIYEKFAKKERWNYSDFIETINRITNVSEITIEPEKAKATPRFNFDPNTVTSSQLNELGFSKKQIAVLINYREAGGTFFKKSDLKKIYGISEDFYKELAPYISIAPSLATNNKDKNDLSKNRATYPVTHKKMDDSTYEQPKYNSGLLIELNAASIEDLVLLPGIGPGFAKRIVKYRTYLGGFHKKEQLTEVYGLTDTLLLKIAPFIEIDTSSILKINLNEIEFNTLNKHPYIDYIQTKNIFKYRELMGFIAKPDELIHNHLMDSLTYQKMLPYLKCD